MLDKAEPLKIRLVVLNLLIPSMPMHLDDILAAAAVNAARSTSRGEISDYSQIIDHLPIEKHASGGEWVYKASILEFIHMYGKFMRPVSRRINKSLFALRRAEGTLQSRGNKLNLKSGPLKVSIGLMPTAARVEAVGYCVGCRDSIIELFNHLTHIGKKHNRGQGEILTLEVFGNQEAELWRKRFLPLSMKDQKLPKHAHTPDIGTRPPYWKNRHSVALGIPNFF